MNYSLRELLMCGCALLVLPAFFLSPGYVVASASGLMSFRSQGWIERVLWAVALSAPVSVFLAAHPFVPISPRLTTAVFVLLTASAAGLVLRDYRRDNRGFSLSWDRNATVAVFAAAFLALYCVLSAAPIKIHGLLYESSIWQDWNVRFQLVNAAIRGGNDPRNPMFAPAGRAAPLRYYYFWYVLCARMHDLAPVSARAIFTASCVGTSFSLLAFLFLSLKYLTDAGSRIRTHATALLLGSCILGMDLIAIAIILCFFRHSFYPDIAFWLEDRTPRLLHVVLWSPHHAAGLVCAGMGTLLLVNCLELPTRQRTVNMVLAAICFAAGAGTSTFIVLLFSSALLFVMIDALIRREWTVVVPIVGAGLIALLCDATYFHHLLATTSGTATDKSGLPLLRPFPRFMDQALRVVWLGMDAFGRAFLHRRLYPGPTPARGMLKLELAILHRPVLLALFFLDLGFFTFILFGQVRKDFVSGKLMSRRARVLWLIFLGIGIPGTRLTSGALQSNNDFARHAGLGMEFILLLWSAPFIADYLANRKQAKRAHQKLNLSLVSKAAVVCALIGISGQVVQIIFDRVQVPLTDLGVFPRVVVPEYVPRLGFRFAQIQQAMDAATRVTPQMGIVQGNPHSILAPVFLLYTERQMAASDDGCNTPFGGDPRACLPLTRGLVELFGGTGAHYFTDLSVLQRPISFNPDDVTPAQFARVCHADKLDTVVATYTDPVWWDKASWVWQLQPTFANSTMRVFQCA